MPATKSNWDTIEFPEQNVINFEWEDLAIRIIRRESDLLLLENLEGADVPSEHGAVLDTGYKRYAFQAPVKKIRAEPRTPDRPLVVHPLHPLCLAPNAKVVFYVSIPVDIQLLTQTTGDFEELECIRGEILSDTWFGDQISGILCYALISRARRECPTIDSDKTARAICKIEINNKADEQLQCEKFCIRLDHCHLWKSGSSLWTSPINIRYNGSDQLSAIDYSDKAPTEADKAVKVAKAKEEPLRGLIRRTFAGLGNTLT